MSGNGKMEWPDGSAFEAGHATGVNPRPLPLLYSPLPPPPSPPCTQPTPHVPTPVIYFAPTPPEPYASNAPTRR